MSFGGAFEMETSAPLFFLCQSAIFVIRKRGGQNVRGKVTAFACQDSDEDIIHNRNFLHQFGKAEVMISIECIQLLWQIERDDGDMASGLQGDVLLDLRHC
jgi:hypothetical protein